jgi:hypothetical protein
MSIAKSGFLFVGHLLLFIQFTISIKDYPLPKLFIYFIAYIILAGKPEGKRPLGRPRCRWNYNIKMNLREIGWGGMDWTDVAQDRDQWRALVNTVMNLPVP